MRPLAPITVTSADFDVFLVPDGIQAAITPGSVRCANESQFALLCSLGADTHWLDPWSIDVFPVHSTTLMHVHPVQLVTPQPASPWNTLLVTVAQPYETIPGVYPAPLSRQISSYEIPTPLIAAEHQDLQTGGFYSIAQVATLTFTFTLPQGTQTVRFEAFTGNLGASWTNFQIKGNVSGKTYAFHSNLSFPASGFDINDTFRPLAVDTQLVFSLTTTSATQWVFTLESATSVRDVVAELGGTIGIFQATPLIVSQSSSLIPGWVFPQSAAVSLGAALGANGTATVVAGVTGKIIYVHKWSIVASIAAFLNLEDGGGQRIAGCNPQANVEHVEAPVGQTRPGFDLVLRNGSGALVYTQGVSYTQA